jgi:hypothetical protein
MLIVMVLAQRLQYSIDRSSSPSVTLPSFVFQPGGQFEVTIAQAAADAVFVGVCTASEVGSLQSLTNPDDALCLPNSTLVHLSTKLVLQNSSGCFEGTVTDYGSYTAVLYACGQIFARFDVVATFRNPTSCLSADVQPCLIMIPIVIGICGLLFIVWVANWIHHFTFRNAMHGLLTLTFVLNLANLTVADLELVHQDASDDPTALTQVHLALNLAVLIGLIGILLMAVRGWSIVADGMRWWEVLSCFFSSAFVVVPLAAIELDNIDGIARPICLVIAMIGIAVYCQRMVSGIRRASSYLLGHLLVISRNGIDATTTPVYGKFRLFKILISSILLYFSVISITLIIRQFVTPGYWIIELVNNAVSIFIISTTMWAFRLVRSKTTNYMMITQEETEASKTCELMRWEIDGLGPDSQEFKSGQKVWHKGMTLPAQPVFLDDIADDDIIMVPRQHDPAPGQDQNSTHEDLYPNDML